MKKNLILLCSLLTGFTLQPIQTNAQKATNDQKLFYPYSFAPSEGLVNKTEKEHRQEICLNGYWDFQPVSLPKEYKQGKGVAPQLSLPKDGNGWSKTRIKIPSPWNINSFGYRDLEGPDHRNYPSYPKEWEQVKMAWMKKNITIPANWTGQQIKLYFEAVAGYSEIYINQEKVGENFDLFLPFSFDITDKVTPGETVEILEEKVKLALANGLTPIFCIGEVLEEREANKQNEVVAAQLASVFSLSAEDFSKIILAYEPVWAIGTGKTATPAQAQEIHAFIRSAVAEKYGKEIAENCSILYGGSCKPSNAKELFANPDVDGGLIGGAALKVADFKGIIDAFN